MLTTKNRLQLLQKMATCTRFKNIKLMGYINDINMDLEKQFAAMTYRLDLNTYLVVFRGTDDSIIGWKEDFHMTYMNHIPAQKSALSYLEAVMKHYPKARFLVAGHSKGGNLATYAGSLIAPELQERIEQIFSYDAPGLNKAIIETVGYQACSDKIQRYIPQGSIVGMMLESPEPAQIVTSAAIGGLAQHNTFSWQVEKERFVLQDSLTSDSQQTDKTLKNWVQEIPDQELKDFFDTFFGVILDAGIESIDDLNNLDSLRKVREIFHNLQNLEPEKQEMLARLGRQLFDTRYQMWKEGRENSKMFERLLGPASETEESPDNK